MSASSQITAEYLAGIYSDAEGNTMDGMRALAAMFNARLQSLAAESGQMRAIAEEAANTLEAIAEATWDKRHPDEIKTGCDHASELAGYYEEIRKELAAIGEPA